MKSIYIVLLIFNFQVASSQNVQLAIDSLNKVLRHTQKPADKIPVMDNLCSYYGYLGLTDSLRTLSEQMLTIANEIKEDSLISNAYIELGYYFYLTSDYKQSLEFDFEALALAYKSKSGNMIWFSNKETGATFKELKNFPEALKYLKRSELFLKQALDKSSSNRTYSHTAETFLGLGQTDSALRYVQLTNEVTSKENDAYGFARMLYIFARVYKAKGDTDLAESYYKKCIAFSEAENINLPYITACTDYGQYLFNTSHYDLSKQYALAGFNKAKQAKNKLEVINTSDLLRKAYYSTGEKDSSYYYSEVKMLIATVYLVNSKEMKFRTSHLPKK